MRIISFPFLSILALLSLSQLRTDARTVEVRFLGVETARSDLFIQTGTDFEPISIPLYKDSAYHQAGVPESGLLKLYSKAETKDGPRFEIVTEATIPKGAQSALGVYIIAPNGQPKLYLYNDDWAQFPGQSYRLINISPVVINSKVDESMLQLQPFESDVVEVEIASRLPLVRIITVYKNGKNEWESIYNQRTALLPEWRITGIAVVTKGKLAEAMGIPSIEEDTDPEKATLRYLSFKDSGLKSADKVARAPTVE